MVTQVETVMQGKTLCICGHEKICNDMKMQDNLCLQTSCLCWDFSQSQSPQPEPSRKEKKKKTIPEMELMRVV